VVESLTKESYVDIVVHFRDVCKKFAKLLTYIETTILNIVKEKIVREWTDRVLHLGCRTDDKASYDILAMFLVLFPCI